MDKQKVAIKNIKYYTDVYFDHAYTILWKVVKIGLIVLIFNLVINWFFRYEAKQVFVQEWENVQFACDGRVEAVKQQFFSDKAGVIKFKCIDKDN